MSAYKTLVLSLQVLFVLAIQAHASDETFIFGCLPPPPPPRQSPTNNFVVYLQAILQNGTDSAIETTAEVAGIQGKPISRNQYGSVLVADQNITSTASPNSTLLGQSLGTLVVAALDGSRLQNSLTFVFMNGPYAGSTLVLLGIDPEVAIVGGTNKFADATGYVIFSFFLLYGSNVVIMANVTYKVAP